MQKLFLVVPVYNEEPNMGTLFAAFRSLDQKFRGRFNITIILVDDGSRDETIRVARSSSNGLNLEVLAHDNNKGPGAAFATAFASLASRINERDWVITMEGDNTSKHELIEQMFTRSKEGFDVILASPYMYGGGLIQTSFLRKFLSGGANFIVKDFLGVQGILTVSSFFRVYRGGVILRMNRVFGRGIIESAGFEGMVEMVMKMTMLRLSISEVAMQLDVSLRKGKSKMKILKTIRGYVALGFRKSAWLQLAEREIRQRGSL